MTTINEHIDRDIIELMQADLDDNQAKKRHLESELHALEEYKWNHPAEDHDPNSLELYCDAHPDAPECRIYED